MNLSVSFLQTQHLSRRLHTPMDLLWLSVWSFALPSLMFLVPETGFGWIYWNHTDANLPLMEVLGGTMILFISSLLPVAIYLEARRASKRGDLNKKGLALYILFGVIGASLLGFGLPLFYVSYMLPNDLITALPYTMALGGFVVWMMMLLTRKVLVR